MSIDELPPESLERMRELMIQIGSMYPAFKSQVMESPEGLEIAMVSWYNVFKTHQMSAEMAFNALYRVQGRKFYPYPTASDLVAEAELNQDDLGLLSEEAAFQEAAKKRDPVRDDWSHLAAYHAAKKTGFFFLKTEVAAKTRPAFVSHYRELVKQVMQGVELSPRPAPVERQVTFEKEKLPVEDQLSILADIRGAVGL